jgi:hypothetical protein
MASSTPSKRQVREARRAAGEYLGRHGVGGAIKHLRLTFDRPAWTDGPEQVQVLCRGANGVGVGTAATEKEARARAVASYLQHRELALITGDFEALA